MFYKIQRKETLILKPRFVDQRYKENILIQIRNKFEGSVTSRYGFTIAITKLDRIDGGTIDVTDGSVHFDVTFECLVMRPMVGDVLWGKVVSVAASGVFTECGPLRVFIEKRNIADGQLQYNEAENTFVSSELTIATDEYVRIQITSAKNLDGNSLCIGQIIKQQD